MTKIEHQVLHFMLFLILISSIFTITVSAALLGASPKATINDSNLYLARKAAKMVHVDALLYQ